MEEHWSSANFFRNFPRRKKVLCMWSKMHMYWYFMGQSLQLTYQMAIDQSLYFYHFIEPILSRCRENSLLLKFDCQHFLIFVIIGWRNWHTMILTNQKLCMIASSAQGAKSSTEGVYFTNWIAHGYRSREDMEHFPQCIVSNEVFCTGHVGW